MKRVVFGRASLRRGDAMSGWRDADGRTAAQRKKSEREGERARFAETVRYRPLSLLKGLLGFAFVMVIVFALIGALR
jgi:hypothetical protein